tara:strand:- start:1912 stop:2103 length:192 start_codon:yes stop_codon:yes gene_type:complete
MKTLGLVIAVFFGALLPATESVAHMYDSMGGQAGSHDHDHSHSGTPEMKDNCFIDPKLGPICK